MGIEEFRRAFRNAPLDGGAPYRAPINNGRLNSVAVMPPPSPTKKPPAGLAAANGDQKSACLFYSIGKCRYGKSCKLLHIDPPMDKASTEPQAATDIPPSTSPSSATPSTTTTTPLGARLDMSINASSPTKLPQAWEIPEGCVPVNRSNHRLDAYIPPASPAATSTLMARIDRRRVCNAFHLQGFCDAGDRCEYDHGPLDAGCLPALEALARTQPCPRRGGCRLLGCTHGHVCQNPDCKHRGGKAYCKIPYLAHLEDAEAVRYEQGVVNPKMAARGGGGAGAGSRKTPVEGSESGSSGA
jgi:hypothetical protein